VVSLSSIAGADSGIVRERPFQLLLLINVLPPLGTALLSPVLGSLVEPLGASTANIGLMMSAFTAPSIFVIPIAGVISDRYGRRPVLIFGLCWFGLTGTAIAFVSTFGAALALRALQGIGFAALTPIIITSLGDLYAGTKEATAQGLRFTGSGLSQTAFPLAAGVLVGVAWQYPFLLYAVVAFPIAAVVYVYFEEPLDEAPDEESEAGIREQLDDMRTLVAHRRAWAMVAARGTANIAWFGFLTYNSILVVNVLGYTPTEAGILAALASLTYALAASQAGRIADLFDDRLYPLVATNLSMGAGLALTFLARRSRSPPSASCSWEPGSGSCSPSTGASSRRSRPRTCAADSSASARAAGARRRRQLRLSWVLPSRSRPPHSGSRPRFARWEWEPVSSAPASESPVSS